MESLICNFLRQFSFTGHTILELCVLWHAAIVPFLCCSVPFYEFTTFGFQCLAIINRAALNIHGWVFL